MGPVHRAQWLPIILGLRVAVTSLLGLQANLADSKATKGPPQAEEQTKAGKAKAGKAKAGKAKAGQGQGGEEPGAASTGNRSRDYGSSLTRPSPTC